jgi:hypothetical protein
MENFAAAQEIDYERIERAGQRPVALALDGKEIAYTLVDRNSLAIDSRDSDIVYGYGGVKDELDQV